VRRCRHLHHHHLHHHRLLLHRAHLRTTPTAVSNEYFCELDANGLRRDRLERPELTLGTVEFVAPAEYMVRPPQPPVFLL